MSETFFLDDLNAEEIEPAILSAILAAVHDKEPKLTLAQIQRAVSSHGLSSSLDALNLVPILLPCADDAAWEIVSLISECGSAKEMVIAIEEALERLCSSMTSESDDEDASEDGSPEKLSPAAQLAHLMLLYAAAIPRLKLRKKSASETITPLIVHIESAVKLVSPQSNRTEGRALISNVAHLVQNTICWIKTVHPGIDTTETARCAIALKQLLDTTVNALAHSIDSSLAQRTFKALYPRLVNPRTILPNDWEDGANAVTEAKAASDALAIPDTGVASLTSLVFLTHSHQLMQLAEPNTLLPSFLPIILASLQSNAAADEALTILLASFHAASQSPCYELSPHIIIPLSILLSPLASAHPDSTTRRIAFRILSLLLSLSPAVLRLQLLQGLTSDEDFPQMRAASIGLVKEAILAALQKADTTENGGGGGDSLVDVFASRSILDTMGYDIFRPSPPDLFKSTALSAEDFLDSGEPGRLTECLSFYFVLLRRDTNNRTGVRDAKSMNRVEESLLKPLRETLERWSHVEEEHLYLESADKEHEHHHHSELSMALMSLQMGLDRVGDAIRGITGSET